MVWSKERSRGLPGAAFVRRSGADLGATRAAIGGAGSRVGGAEAGMDRGGVVRRTNAFSIRRACG